jgi:glucan phosphoethanolaminetransferase (alkaline phosphatase superfamily)
MRSQILSLVAALVAACLPLASAADQTPPNIVFLLADDQATISMSCYGNPDPITPNLDSLSARGVTFDNHYAATDPDSKIALEQMRTRYDRALADLKQRAIGKHAIYAKLFDRSIP